MFEIAIAEIKIRVKDDTRKWESIGVYDRIAGNRIYEKISELLHCDDIQEVRWNYAGSMQGHYHARPPQLESA